VSIQCKISRDHFCGGSIIKPDIVVTAAHCLDGHVYVLLVVQAGILDLKNPPIYSQLRDVQKMTLHELYSPLEEDNDIALLKLEVPFHFNESDGHIGAICLPPKDRPLAGDVEVTGWGDTEIGNGGLSF
ncbi:unnamed protein product, partial [Ixodes persulcatus]